MNLANVAYLYASNLVWRSTRMRPLGRVLVHALASENEMLRATAGMFLVHAGQQSIPLLREAVNKRQNLPIVLTLIADIGDRQFVPALQEFANDRDSEVAQAARDALRVFSMREQSARSQK